MKFEVVAYVGKGWDMGICEWHELMSISEKIHLGSVMNSSYKGTRFGDGQEIYWDYITTDLHTMRM